MSNKRFADRWVTRANSWLRACASFFGSAYFNPTLLTFFTTLSFLLYYPSLTAGFIHDDYFLIVNNPFIKHLNLETIWKFDPTRFFTNLSFAVNYKFFGLRAVYWHVADILLHALNVFLVYHLTALTFQTPYFQKQPRRAGEALIPLAAALIFLLHPVQSQAVIYLTQRATLLAALCYLGALYCYARARLKDDNYWYTWAVLISGAGMFTKPVFMTLPLTIAIYDIFFWGWNSREVNYKRAVIYLLLTLPLVIVPLSILVNTIFVEVATSGYVGAGLGTHVLTQLSAFVTYARILIFPIFQNFDYDYSYVTHWLEPRLLASLVFLVAVVIGIRRFRYQREAWFCFIWFFLTLSSSPVFFPVPEVFFEHWLYLSSYGFALMIAFFVFRWATWRMVFMFILAGLLLGFSSLTYQRAKVWRDPLILLADTAAKSPHKARVRNNLGYVYFERGMFPQAQREFEKTLELDPEYDGAANNLAYLYLQEGRLEESKKLLDRLLLLSPQFEDAVVNLGNVYVKMGNPDKAREQFEKAKKVNPFSAAAHIGLGNLYQEKQEWDKAKTEFDVALWLNPDSSTVSFNLGNLNYKQGRLYDALMYYQQALKIKPDFAEAMNNIGNIYFYFHDFKRAGEFFQKAIDSSPAAAQGHYNLANTLYALGRVEDSRRSIKTALRLWEAQGQEQVADALRRRMGSTLD